LTKRVLARNGFLLARLSLHIALPRGSELSSNIDRMENLEEAADGGESAWPRRRRTREIKELRTNRRWEEDSGREDEGDRKEERREKGRTVGREGG